MNMEDKTGKVRQISFTDDFVKALKKRGHDAQGFIHEHTEQVSYFIDGYNYSTSDVDKSEFAEIKRRALFKQDNE